jgi:lipooligosaccharide transport system permease protein
VRGAPDAATYGPALRVLPPLPRLGRARHLVERNFLVFRRAWVIVVSGFFEPLFYLLSIGAGISALVGEVTGPGGRMLSYTEFVAPAMLAASAMNGAIFETTFNVFFKLRYEKTYDAVLATPLTARDVAVGDVTWALVRGGTYSAMFCVVLAGLGHMDSWWALLALPAALLIGFAFAAVGMAATTFMRSWQDFEYVNMAILPMFLFSATFYPLAAYPPGLQWVVRATPLYHGVELERGLVTGAVGPGLLGHAAYLTVMGAVALSIATRRLDRILLR